MNEQEHIISDQATQCQHLHCEKVRTRKDRHVRALEVYPGLRTPRMRQGKNAWGVLPCWNQTTDEFFDHTGTGHRFHAMNHFQRTYGPGCA